MDLQASSGRSLKPSYIPRSRQLRDLTRYRNKLIQQIASEKNRMMRILEDCNIKLSSVVSNTSGTTATLIDMLCEGKVLTLVDINSVYHGKLSASPEELLEACTGFVEEHHIYLLQMIRKDIDQTQTLVDDLSERIKRLLSKYENVLELLREIPGFSTKVVEDLVSEIGLDMSHFLLKSIFRPGPVFLRATTRVRVKKKRTNHSRKQTGKGGNHRSRMGRDPYKEYVLVKDTIV